jgi:hypothetical protein
VTVVTVLACIGLLIMGAVTTYALQQRNEAQAQREEAERRRVQADGLVDFMLTDLRERLNSVGRIDILRSAAEQAMTSYSRGAEAGPLPAESQGRLARLLLAMAANDFDAGNKRQAMASVAQAYRTTARQLADAPLNADRIYDHAQSEYWMGYGWLVFRDNTRTTEHWQRYRSLAGRLATVEPNTQRSLKELAFADGNLCNLALMTGRDGIVRCQIALASQRRLASTYPQNREIQITLMNRLSVMADATDRSSDGAGGGDYRSEQLAIGRRLIAGEPDNWQYREYLVRALVSAADADTHSNVARSAQYRDEARTLIGTMLRHDPQNRTWIVLNELLEQ